MNDVTISFAVTVCDEHQDLENLLHQLTSSVLKDTDEIIILSDSSKVTPEVLTVISKYATQQNIKHISKPLNGNFAKFKNNFLKVCTKDYIFQIDADETLGSFLYLIHDLIQSNLEQDLFVLSRINTVNGLDMQYAMNIGWRVDENNTYDQLPIINWPDCQYRLFKNNIGIKWVGKVHEKLVGHKTFTLIGNGKVDDVAENRKFSLIHQKTFARQLKQNKFYETLI